MADKSNIEWTDATWNPITGCSIVSPGCRVCYAMKLAGGRLRHHPSRKGLTTMTKTGPIWNGEVRLNESWLTQPLEWSKPRMIFVCAHGDLFHENVPDEWIDKVFTVMALAGNHTFQVLTKRNNRMLAAVARIGKSIDILERQARVLGYTLKFEGKGLCPWPLRNVWLGVSAERQKEADERIPDLLQTPAAVRFVSLEPLLGPIDLTSLGDVTMKLNAFTGEASHVLGMRDKTRGLLDWIIVGGESGSDAMPFDVDWARSILRDCRAAGVKAFLKQLGSNPYSDGRPMHAVPRGKYGDPEKWSPELRVREMPI